MGRYDEARSYLEQSLALARELNDEKRIAAVLQPLGSAYMGQGDIAGARAVLDEAVAVARSVGNPRQLASALSLRAQVLRLDRDFETAARMYGETVDIARRIGDRESAAIGLLNLAIVAIGRGAPAEAAHLLTEALAIARETGSQLLGQGALDVAAGLCSATGKHRLALEFFGASEAQAERSGLRRDNADDAFLRPLIEQSRVALGDARAEEARREGGAWPCEEAIERASAGVMA
jgi:tetratricopeptide (TPR) repeat protein